MQNVMSRRSGLSQLSISELVAELRANNVDASREFDVRFRSTLQAYARRVRIPPDQSSALITDVLTDEALRLADPISTIPTNVAGYLIRTLRHRYLNSRRSTERRERRYVEAADNVTGEWIVTSLCSEDALRSSAGPDDLDSPSRSVLTRLASDLRSQMTPEEQSILLWIGQGASHVEISEWLGVSYVSSTKRIWRLCQRLRTAACQRAASYSQGERSEFERFLRRSRTQSPPKRAVVSA